MEEVLRVIVFCKICAEEKPRFYPSPQIFLIKVTQLMNA